MVDDALKSAAQAALRAIEHGEGPQVIQSMETPPRADASGPSVLGVFSGPASAFWRGAAFTDNIPAWGTGVGIRDARLQSFVFSDSLTASAFGTVVGRNAAFSWEVGGEGRNRDRAHEMLLNAEWGQGWVAFCTNMGWDYLMSDRGAFMEVIHEEPSRADSPVVGVKSLPAMHCWPSGNPEYPAYYLDAVSGKLHRMGWWQVQQIRELAIRHPLLPGLQLSAASRVVQLANVWRSMMVYYDEKVSGKNPRAIHIVTGVQQDQIDAALKIADTRSEQRGNLAYITPAILANPSPEAIAHVASLALASLPDGFDQQAFFQQLLVILAMGLLVDLQELAPLPSGNIGTGTQSETLDEKSKRKGAALWRKQMAQIFNQYVLPKNVTMRYDEEDIPEETARANNRHVRAQARGVQVATGELDAAGARQQALDDGDMSEELYLEMNERDLTNDAIRQEERANVLGEIQQAARIASAGKAMPGAPAGPLTTTDDGGDGTEGGAGTGSGPDDEDSPTAAARDLAGRLDLEERTTAATSRALAELNREIRRNLRESA